MGRPRLISGPHQVENAHRLFLQSVERGSPDFRYVALAIGAEPFQPPRWAVWECILEKDRTARRAATTLTEVDEILDEVVRYFAGEHFRRDDNPELRERPLPSLQKAIRAACATLGKRTKSLDAPKNADTSWMKDVERAWKREQQEDVVESYHQLLEWKTTKRIADIVEALVAKEFGHPPDLQQYLWMAQRLERDGDQDT